MKKVIGIITAAIFIFSIIPMETVVAQDDDAKAQRIKEEIRAHKEAIQRLKGELGQTAGSQEMGSAEYSDAESSYGQENMPVSSEEGKPGDMRGRGPKPGEGKPGDMKGKRSKPGEGKPGKGKQGEIKGKGPRAGGNQKNMQKERGSKTSGKGRSGGKPAGNRGGGRKR
ncbi:MAG: hypothetical protein ABIH09_06265 [Candidatus Omnitrophota bacterium]